MEKIIKNIVIMSLVLLVLTVPRLIAQESDDSTSFKQEELEQMLAPIALYPDSLLSQILMASTYPLEVVQAQRWAEDNKSLKGDAITAALEKKNWDPSVKSLVNFPNVLNMMSEKLDLTQKLGDAFLSQQKDVMDTVQTLRKKAYEQGNLKTTEEQAVKVEQEIIVIETSQPQVVYIPEYDPVVIYGTWPYPAYPPYYYYPYPPRPTLYSFGAGVAVGAAWGYAWGNCDWHGGDIDIDIDRNLNLNQNINRGQFNQGGKGKWQHNPENRKGVAYRDQKTAQKFNRTSTADAVKSREAYRGRTEQGRQNLDRSGVNQLDNRQSPAQTRNLNQKPASRDLSQRGDGGVSRQNAASRSSPAGATRPTSSNMSASSNRGSAFQDINRGSASRNYSSRGQVSRQSMSRPSGGGSRGGGGGRGGGGRR